VSSPDIRAEIQSQLFAGAVTVDRDGDVRDAFGFGKDVSKTQASLAMGRLVEDDIVRRERPHPESITSGDEPRPIRYSLR